MWSVIRAPSSRPRAILGPTGGATSIPITSGRSAAKAAAPTSSDRLPCSTKQRSRADTEQERIMQKNSDPQPSVATFADHEVIRPPNKLRRAVLTVKDTDPPDDPVSRADAVRAIIREHSRPDAAATSEALTKKLRDVTDNFLLQVNRDRPDYVATVLSPPTAPNEGMF